jgi:bleomycin hydrolase
MIFHLALQLRGGVRVPCALVLAVALVSLLAGPVAAKPGDPIYKPEYKYPVLDEIRATRDSLQALRDSLRVAVDRRYAAQKKQDKEQKLSLRMDWSGIDKPASPEAFSTPYHFPPVAQYLTGTCWAFSSTSFFESEVARLTGRHVKLSEMWTVYWEYVEKARRYVREYGHQPIEEGSEEDGTQEIYRQYGAVPEEAYIGCLRPDDRHDHGPLRDEIASYLEWVKAHDTWDEEQNVAYVRSILDRYLGPPPDSFTFEGQTYTPKQFLADVLRLKMDDYERVVSTLRYPFGQRVLLDVPDNWRRKDDYLNLPLRDFSRVIKEAARAGYTVSIGGDLSEPCLDGMEDAAVIPAWDIPAKYIDQASRELRINNGTTSDDHGVHLIGFLHHGGRDWFLIKDSNRSSRLGKFKGYYFYDGDYIKLKMLSFMVHKDRLAGIAPGTEEPGAQ